LKSVTSIKYLAYIYITIKTNNAMTTEQMTVKIEAKIQKLVSLGYSKKEATSMIEKALKLVTEGKKAITDVIDLD
jgi:Holliday junction resolvasome RuvABC DNA-binding subunit